MFGGSHVTMSLRTPEECGTLSLLPHSAHRASVQTTNWLLKSPKNMFKTKYLALFLLP